MVSITIAIQYFTGDILTTPVSIGKHCTVYRQKCGNMVTAGYSGVGTAYVFQWPHQLSCYKAFPY